VALLALRAAGVFDEVCGLVLLRAGPKASERRRFDQWECTAEQRVQQRLLCVRNTPRRAAR
jgi:hypothetical protein